MQGSKVMWCLAICSLFLLLFLSDLDALTKTGHFLSSGFRGLPKIPPLVSTTVAIKAVCAIACERLEACKSFSFHSGSEGCSLFPRRIMALDVDPSVPSEDAHFFRVLASCPAWKGYVAVPGTTKCIRVGDVEIPWAKAADVCAEDGCHLLIIENADLMQKLQDFVPEGSYHVGFNDMDTEDEFLWLDRTPVNRTLFAANEPSDSTTNASADCGTLGVNLHNPGLRDLICSKTRGFLCSLPMKE